MLRKVKTAPPPTHIQDTNHSSWKTWFSLLHERVGEGPFLLQGYSEDNLPSAEDHGNKIGNDPFSSLIFVVRSDGTDYLAYSTGVVWKRLEGVNLTGGDS